MPASSPNDQSHHESDLINGLTRAERRLTGSVGGLRSWANLDPEERDSRIGKTQRSSPSQIAWHAAKRGWNVDRLTLDQIKRAEQDRRAYFRLLSAKSAVSRRKRKNLK